MTSPTISSRREHWCRLIAIAVSFAVVHLGATAHGATWSYTGGPEGGTIYAMVIDPTSSQHGYAATDGGVFETENAGASWRFVEGFVAVRGLAFDPFDPSRLYVAAFNELAVLTRDPTGHRRESIDLSGTLGFVEMFAVDHQTPGTIFVGTSSGVFKSTDYGINWHATELDFYEPTDLAIDPVTATRMYAATSDGIFRSEDGGEHWDATGDVWYMLDVAVAPSVPSVVYALNGGRLSVSRDFGLTWSHKTLPLPWYGIALEVHPTDPETVYVGTIQHGLFVSTNAGDSWTSRSNGLTNPSVSFVTFDRSDPDIVYVGTGESIGGRGSGLFKTTTAGASWAPRNDGLSQSVEDLVPDLGSGGAIYAGTRSGGVFKRSPGAAGWEQLSTGGAYALVAHPTSPTTLYRGDLSLAYESTDGGLHWSVLDAQTPIAARTMVVTQTNPPVLYAITLDQVFRMDLSERKWHEVGPDLSSYPYPFFASLAVNPHDADEVYVTFFLGGILKTTSGGLAGWAPADAGIRSEPNEAPHVYDLAVHPTEPNVLYVAALTSTARGIWRSGDAGATWTLQSDQAGYDFLLDPTDADTLYLGSSERVLKSTDAGVSWEDLGVGLPEGAILTQLTIHPANPGVLYGSAGPYGIFALDLVPAGEPTTTPAVTPTPTPQRTPDAVETTLPQGGGCCTTDTQGSGPTVIDPIETLVCSSTGGACTIKEDDAPSLSPRAGYRVVGHEITITAPKGSATQPLALRFAIDASDMPAGQDWRTLQILRNGDVVRPCVGAAGTAVPDPCLARRRPTTGGGAELTVLSSAASVWTVVVSSLDAHLCFGTKGVRGGPVYVPALGTRLRESAQTLQPNVSNGAALLDAAPTTFDLTKPRNFCSPMAQGLADVPSSEVGYQSYALKASKKICSDDARACTTASDCVSPDATCSAQARKVCADDGRPCIANGDCTAPAKCIAHKKFLANADIVATSALGEMVVNLGKATEVLVPTTRTPNGSLPVGVPLDHYKCYAVKVAKDRCVGNPAQSCTSDAQCGVAGPCFRGFVPTTVSLHDEAFTPSSKTFTVKKPTTLCLPVRAGDIEPSVPTTSIQCWVITPSSGEPKHVPTSLQLHNAIGSLARRTVKEVSLCLPVEAVAKTSTQ